MSLTAKRKEKLLYDARMAMAWGEPDQECIGYSRGELINIIARLVEQVEKIPATWVTDDI
jgi:hypothetical protein